MSPRFLRHFYELPSRPSNYAHCHPNFTKSRPVDARFGSSNFRITQVPWHLLPNGRSGQTGPEPTSVACPFSRRSGHADDRPLCATGSRSITVHYAKCATPPLELIWFVPKLCQSANQLHLRNFVGVTFALRRQVSSLLVRKARKKEY
jgi:hypothetical protein